MAVDPRHELPPVADWPPFREDFEAIGFDPARKARQKRRSEETNQVLMGVVAALGSGLIVVLTWLGIAFALTGEAFPRDMGDGKWAQTDAATRHWFRTQLVPRGEHKGTSCCSAADGASAEEDIRAGVYWVRFAACDYYNPSVCIQVDWQPVPGDAVLDGPNHRGVPIVWWYFSEDTKGYRIRCYAPGPKV
jgi:hypothetical protein